MKDLSLRIVITAIIDQFKQAIGVARQQIDGFSETVNQSDSMVGRWRDRLGGMQGVFSGLGLGALATDVLATNREFESLRTQLDSVTGSADSGKAAWEGILQRATDTVFEVSALTKTFVMLKNFGLEPTEKVMTALTEQAAKLGGSEETLSGITLALGQAWGKGKLQAEEANQMIERGVPVYALLSEATGKSAAELQAMAEKGELTRAVIEKLITKMGELAAGSNARAMNNLNGKISVLSDSWRKFEDTLLQDKSEVLIKRIVGNWSDWLDEFSARMDVAASKLGRLNELNAKIAANKSALAGDLSGGGKILNPAERGRALAENAALEVERDKLIQAIHDETKARIDAAAAANKAKADAQAKEDAKTALADSVKGGKATPFDAQFAAAEQANNLPVGLLKAIADVETGGKFNPKAVSPAGAQGLMQFMPDTAARFNLSDPFNADDSIQAAGQYFRKLLDLFNGDLVKAVAAYNAGEGNVQKRGIDTVLSPQFAKGETQAYVPKVMGKLEDYGNTTGLQQQTEADIKAAETRRKLAADTAKFEQEQRLATAEAANRADQLEITKLEASYQARHTTATDYYQSLQAIQTRQSQRTITALEENLTEERKLQTQRQMDTDEYQQGAQRIIVLEQKLKQVRDEAVAAAVRNQLALEKANQKQADDLALILAEAGRDAKMDDVGSKETRLQQDVSLGTVDHNQQLAELQAFANRRYEIELDLLNKKRALMEGDTLALAQNQAQQDALTRQHQATLQGLLNDDARARKAEFSELVQPFSNAVDQMVNGVLAGQQTIGRAVRNAAANMLTSYAAAFIKKRVMNAAEWTWEVAGFAGAEAKKKAIKDAGLIWDGVLWVKEKALKLGAWAWDLMGFGSKEAAKVGMKASSEVAQTGAQIAGDATRTASAATAATTTKAIDATTGMSKIMARAATAAAGAYEAVVAIPIVGPVLAPIAAGVAFAAVSAFGALFSARGGEWRVGGTESGTPYILHPNETVLPNGTADDFRKVVGIVRSHVAPAQSPLAEIDGLFRSGHLPRQLALPDFALAMPDQSQANANAMVAQMVARQSQADSTEGQSGAQSKGGHTFINVGDGVMSVEEFFDSHQTVIVKRLGKAARNFVKPGK